MKRTKILVTGAGGQLGSELRAIAPAFQEYEFIFTTHRDLSIENEKDVFSFFNTAKPGYCINAAAYTAVDKAESENETAFAINATAPGILATACANTGCKLVHISTDYVFDGKTRSPYKEDSPVNPTSVYGQSKLAGELNVFDRNHEALVIRTSWVYSQFGKNFVKTMLRLMNEKAELNIVNDQFGSPTYARELAKAIIDIIRNKNWIPGTYHYSNLGVISWFEFAEAIREIKSFDCKIHPIATAEYPTPAKRPFYSVLDTTRIRQTFGIEIRNWKECLQECLQRIDEPI